jgi:TonB family protein
MHAAPGSVQQAERRRPGRDIRLLIAPEPWSRNFLQNLRELFRRKQPGLPLESAPAAFWPDVFVDRRLPWRRFWQSGAYHLLALVAIWQGSRFLALQPQVTPQPIFTHSEVVYYTPSEYLPPINTLPAATAHAQKADPDYSAQPIISVPRQADNRSQTLVAPPNVQLKHDVPIPNIVAWQGDPQIPIGPAPIVLASETSRLAPRMERSIIAPPADVQEDAHRDQQANMQALRGPEPAVIAPPPVVDPSAARRPGDLNIGHTSVIAPAPQLSLNEQRALPTRSSTGLSSRSNQVIAPPPSLGASGGSRAGGNMIALSLHPAAGAPAEPAAGNRRGTFASTPEGHRGASGAAGASSGDNGGKANANGSSSKSSDVPSGLYVGKSSNSVTSPVAGKTGPMDSSAYSVNPNLIASARPPRVSARTLQPESEGKLSDVERSIFGNRKFYSLSLNMPNLNSAAGSWIIRFAAMKGDENSGESYSRQAAERASASITPPDDLSAPSATRKVDPAYPLELMRQNVSGTVILYAVIHADGTVGSIRVLRGVDEQLDRFASEAIAKWQFEPATKNGTPVDVEATFWIPFRPGKTGSNF